MNSRRAARGRQSGAAGCSGTRCGPGSNTVRRERWTEDARSGPVRSESHSYGSQLKRQCDESSHL